MPWHWHPTVELFYVQSGCLECQTPSGRWVFPAGSGGFFNANVLHITKTLPSEDRPVQLLHLFHPTLISGSPDSRIHQRYVLPLLTTGPDVLGLYDRSELEVQALEQVRRAFSIPSEEPGYELRLRNALSEIWMLLFQLGQATPQPHSRSHDDAMKAMMVYVQDHLAEYVSADHLAAAAHISRRLCFQLFQQLLHTTPSAYLLSCRLQKARQMLQEDSCTITEIAYACGFCSSSYFGRQFRAAFGCSPMEYRKSARSC